MEFCHFSSRGLICSFFENSMRQRRWWRHELLLVFLTLIFTCAHGMKVDFSHLRQLRKPYILDKRGGPSCTGNPCPSVKPFLCRSSSVCISLEYVCDGNPDCPDRFDEDKQLCMARNRPSVEQLFEFLERNKAWMKMKLFSGVPMDIVAESLATASSIPDLSAMIGLTPDAERNLEDVMFAVMDGDERPLRKLGMPRGEWYDVHVTLNKLMKGGFEV